MKRAAAVFFDKDGTLIRNVPYNVNPNLIELTTGATESLRLLRSAGFRLFVVSNQSGVARGFFAETDLELVWQKLSELSEIEFDGFYFCPHHPRGEIARYKQECDCRKPAPGLILRAAREHAVDLEKSWFVGDGPQDAAAGRRAGCRTILLDSESESASAGNDEPNFRVKNLIEAAQIILRDLKTSSQYHLR